jgi:beta-glucuronidase
VSRRAARLAALLVAGALLAPATAAADGPAGRTLLGGDWLYRADPADEGLDRGFQKETGTDGWTPVHVPNAFNAGDESPHSQLGSVGWYRKDFTLPNADAALEWAVRFESVNYRARIWLNGEKVGSHTGAHLAFTRDLDDVDRDGVNSLVVRVDSRRGTRDLPRGGITSSGDPRGGWFNYGGILREVYLEPRDTVALDRVAALPDLPCATCAADVELSARVRSVTGRSERAEVLARVGDRWGLLGTRTVKNKPKTVTGTIRVASPHLWTLGDPYLYPVEFAARVGGRTVASWTESIGIRSIEVDDGQLELNGSPVSLRGVGLHEDDPVLGGAIDQAWRERLIAQTQAIGARVLRTHYPLHPGLHDLADRNGILIWSEVPVYDVTSEDIGRRSVQRAALKQLKEDILANRNHPSVMTWSIANELAVRPSSGQKRYIKRAARLVHRLDPSRPASIAITAYPTVECQRKAYKPLDLLGFNEYFGWYDGPRGTLSDRTGAGPMLDKLRACYPRHALMVTEFGAEANRDGPVEEKGTYAFQADWANYQLGVFASKPWLSGAIYWALNEFRIRPGWDGGNPKPSLLPRHQKGLLTFDGWQRKPAWDVVRRWFSGS